MSLEVVGYEYCFSASLLLRNSFFAGFLQYILHFGCRYYQVHKTLFIFYLSYPARIVFSLYILSDPKPGLFCPCQ